MGYLEYRIILTYRYKTDDKGMLIGNPELMKKSFVSAINDTTKVKKIEKDLSLNSSDTMEL